MNRTSYVYQSAELYSPHISVADLDDAGDGPGLPDLRRRPDAGVTEWIVDQLARYDAKATFFCLGKNAEQHPHLFRMLVDGDTA